MTDLLDHPRQLQHASYGGVCAAESRIQSIWRRTESMYRRLLQQARGDALHALTSFSAQGRTAAAAELALHPRMLAASRLILTPYLFLPAAELLAIAKPDADRLVDPLTGVRAHRAGPHTIAWEADIDPSRAEESPLLDAIFHAVDSTPLSPGEGAVHIAECGGREELIWQSTRGAIACGVAHLQAIHL